VNPTIDSGKHEWSNYVLCGYKGVLEHEKRTENLKGFTALIHGTVPQGSGLSSSAALVCASALATTLVNDILLSKAQLADICAKAEQYVGVQSGGYDSLRLMLFDDSKLIWVFCSMDQAISYLGKQGSASKIAFNPLRTEPVPLPAGYAFALLENLSVNPIFF
jgi:N-acetylgalactosamine kinase